MEVIQYLMLSILLSLGPVCGYVISFYTKEEIREGKKWLNLVLKLIILGLAILLMAYNLYPFATSVLIMALVVFYFLYSDFIFFAFGVLFFLASFNEQLLVYVSLLFFLYAMIFGALRRRFKSIIKPGGLFLLSSIMALLIWLFL